MSLLETGIDLALNTEGEQIRQHITDEINKVIKNAADKYASYFDVKWKVICNEKNNTPDVIAKRKLMIDAYITAPQISSEYVRISSEITISVVPEIPK